MHKLEISNIHGDTDSKIIGGVGVEYFKVYNVSDFKTINIVDISIENLCDYFFSYIIYDELAFFDTDNLYNRLLYKLIGKMNETNTDYENKIIYFLKYILDIIPLNYSEYISNNDDFNTIILSQGQYLNHIDLIYEKYQTILNTIKGFENITYISDTIGEPQTQKKYVESIKYNYDKLMIFKNKNSFYDIIIKSETNKTTFTETIKNTVKEMNEIIETLSNKIGKMEDNSYGIEYFLHQYYGYQFNGKNDEDYKKGLREQLSKFFIGSKDIVNLIYFSDKLFLKLISNASNDQFLKHLALYNYKHLEKLIRKKYIDHYNTIKPSDIVINRIPLFYFVIESRKKKIVNTRQDNNVDKMIKIINFYKEGQLVEYYTNDEDINAKVEFGSTQLNIGKIKNVNFINDNNIAITISFLLKKPDNTDFVMSTVNNNEIIDDCNVNLINETDFILCEKKSDTYKKQLAPEKDKITVLYKDNDLFDEKYDKYVFNVTKNDSITDADTYFLINEFHIYIEHKQIESVEPIESDTSIDIEDLEVIDISSEGKDEGKGKSKDGIYISIFKIQDKQLSLIHCVDINNNYIESIEKEEYFNEERKSYVNQEYCILIEKITGGQLHYLDKNDHYYKYYKYYDTLFFIEEINKIKEIIDVTPSI